jgi:hypothetical protein
VATRREGGGGRRTREAKRCRGTGASGVAAWEGGGRGDAGREGGCGAIVGLEGREVAAHVGDLFTGGCRVPITVLGLLVLGFSVGCMRILSLIVILPVTLNYFYAPIHIL